MIVELKLSERRNMERVRGITNGSAEYASGTLSARNTELGATALTILSQVDIDTRDAWRVRASCIVADPDTFFPEKGGSVRDARKVCQKCEVKDQCLEFALENKEPFGVWGGLTQQERKALLRTRERSQSTVVY